MSVYRTDVLYEQIASLEQQISDCQGFGFYDEEREGKLREMLYPAQAELDELLAGPDRFMLQREWQDRQPKETSNG